MTRSNSSRIAVAVTVIGCLAALGSAMLSWHRSGHARRSAFGLASSADALGLVNTPLRRILVICCYVLPLLVAASWTAAALGRRRALALLGALVGAIAVVGGSTVIASFRPQPGPIGAVVAGSAALLGAGWLSRTIRSEPTKQPVTHGRGWE